MDAKYKMDTITIPDHCATMFFAGRYFSVSTKNLRGKKISTDNKKPKIMKHIKSITRIFLSATFFIFCSGHSSAIISKHSATNSAANKGTIVCLIDGKQKTFSVQGFREIKLDFNSKGSSDGILFANGDDKTEGFQFKIKKSGATKIIHPGAGDLYCIINYYNPAGVTYTGKDVTITVTSYNQNKLTGVFSGKLSNVYYSSGSAFPNVKGAKIAKNYPQFIQVTDGKFDLQQ